MAVMTAPVRRLLFNVRHLRSCETENVDFISKVDTHYPHCVYLNLSMTYLHEEIYRYGASSFEKVLEEIRADALY